MSREKEQRREIEDDGRTIYNMDVDGMPHRVKKSNLSGIVLTKKERRAIRRAAIIHVLPQLITIVLGFSLAMLLIWLWLR